MSKVEWYYTAPGQGETVEMEFSSPEEFYSERRRALVELGVRHGSKPEVTTAKAPASAEELAWEYAKKEKGGKA